MRDAPNLNFAWTMLAAEECARLGVRHAVISPGSRSAPLAIAFDQHPDIETHIAHDERGGAFLALGIAKSSGLPAVVVTTSGTAVANTLPAVVEARATRTPILVFTADRPPELHDCGANQTIPQAGLLAPAARWSVDMPCPDDEIPAEFVLSTIDEAFARAVGAGGGLGGGVHVNWRFREPLSPESRPWDIGWLWSIARWTGDRSRAPWRETPTAVAVDATIETGVVVAGRADEAAEESLDRWGGTLLADIGSGLAGRGTVGADLVLRTAFESGRGEPLRRALDAERIVVVGDAPVSKRLLRWISGSSCPVTVFGGGDPRNDPAHRASGAYTGPVHFVAGKSLRPHEGWRKALRSAARAATRALEADRRLTEPTAIATASAACASLRHGTIFYGSSMPIRDADFLAIHPPKGWAVGANRGASGIDGLTATAAGHAVASGLPVLAVVGDVSALHDLSSLRLAAEVETPLVIVVLNNDGGGIFGMLPVAAHGGSFERCFTTPHGVELAPVARALGLAVESPRTRAALAKAVEKGLGCGGATVVEVCCSSSDSSAARSRVHQAVEAALLREFR